MRSVVLLFSVMLLCSLSFALTNVTSCQNLTTPGETYMLVNNIQGSPNTLVINRHCMGIVASGITFDCNGFSITENNTANISYGIALSTLASGVTVQNCPSISGYDGGIIFLDASGNTVRNVSVQNVTDGFFITNVGGSLSNNNNFQGNSVSGFTGNGFWLVEGSGNNFTSNAASGGGVGFNLQTFDPVLKPTENNRFIRNNASNGSIGFSLGDGVASNLFGVNRATGNAGDGFSGGDSPDNDFTSNIASGNGGDGFDISGDNTSSFLDNTAAGNGDSGFEIVASDNVTFNGNLADGNGGGGISFDGIGLGFAGNIANNNSAGGISILTGSFSSISQNNATANGGNGFSIIGDDLVNIALNNALGNDGMGFSAIVGVSANFAINNASNNTGFGFSAITGDFPNFAINYAADNGGMGFSVITGNNPNFAINSARNNTGQGFSVVVGNNSNFAINDASGNGAEGMIANFGTGALFAANSVINNSGVGMVVNGQSANFQANTAAGNAGGFGITGSAHNLTGNTAANNSGFGFSIEAPGTDFRQNTAYGNGGAGLYILDSDGIALTSNHYYGNGVELGLESDFFTPFSFTISGDVFDSPADNFTSYTNLSVNDTLALDSAFSISWSPQPAPLPPDTASFGGKFLDISTVFGSPAPLDDATWHWQDSESTGLNEQGFRLWEYDGAWTLLPSIPDQAANTLSASNLSNFSVFAILQTTTTTGGGDDSGGGSGGNPDLSMGFDPDGNEVTVTSEGSPVPGATVRVNGSIIGTTDSDGKISFSGCGGTAQLSATKTGYGAAALTATLSPCPGCLSDLDCPATMQCTSGVCGPVACSCGSVSNHQCIAYECCADSDCGAGFECSGNSCVPEQPDQCDSDSDCAATMFCEISTGSCKDVTGACGQVIDHKFVPYGYECGSEPGCPACPGGQQCLSHQCVGSDLSCPSSGLVGQSASCTATGCPACDYEVTDPAGKKSTGKAGPGGSLIIPLNTEGQYKITLLRDGQVVKTMEIRSLPKTTPGEEPPPTAGSSGPDLGLVIGLIVLLVLAVLGILYWRSRGTKG